jgi:tRNA pseudouridine(55) synthase
MLIGTKPSGITINQYIEEYKKKYNITKLCFCGRLDPMARGEVILLLGDKCKEMDKYTSVSKTYQFEIILGLQTDSDDVLGIIEKNITLELEEIINKLEEIINIDNKINDYILKSKNKNFNQKFHKYSSKKINGKSMWYYMKNNIEIEQPTHLVNIYDIKKSNYKYYIYNEWRDYIINLINKIDKNCNFNQDEIIKQWMSLNIKKIVSIPMEMKVSSGFYIRQFVRDLSEYINYPLLTYDINRIKLHI